MKRKYFQKIIDVLALTTLCLFLFVSYATIKTTFQKPATIVNPTSPDTTDWLVEQRVIKPVSGCFNGIYPNARIEIEKFEQIPEVPTGTLITTSNTTIDSIDTSLNLYRKKITLDTQANLIPLTNYVLSISVDILMLIRESKVSFTCNQIYFTDEDGKTVIPHWIEYGCGKEMTKFWIRIPSIKPKTKKIIYIYYGNDTKYTYSNFKATFLPEKDLLGWFFFERTKQKKIIDLSGNGNDGLMSTNATADWESENRTFDDHGAIFFNDWIAWGWGHRRKSVYFTVSTKSIKSLAEKGTMELNLKWYDISQQIDQHFFVDSNQKMEIGFSYDGRLFFQNGKTNNRIYFDSNLKKEEWYQIIFTWDFSKKSVILYVDGKQINQLLQRTPFYWKDTKPLGDIYIGGYHTTDENYGFAGYLDGLQIYTKQLSKIEALSVYYKNKNFMRFPKKATGLEEKISSRNKSQEKINFALSANYPRSEQVKLNLLYSTPFNERRYESEEYLKKLKKLVNPPLIIKRTGDKSEPIFGFGSHFYSHIGTQILVKDNFLVNYIGLKINDLSLINDLKINFAWMIDNSNPEIERDIGVLDFIIPRAIACGSYYSYETIGETDLEIICSCNGVSWFRLKKPIFINSATSVMQIEYLPTNKVGTLQIQLVEMLLVGQNKKFIRPYLFQKDPENFEERKHGPKEIVIAKEYKASLLPIEKGSIDFMKNKENGLDLVISNLGNEKILLSDEIYQYWEENVFSAIHIYNSTEQQLLTITINDIRNHVKNQIIEKNHFLHFPILSSRYLLKNNIYYVAFDEIYASWKEEDVQPTKLISWIMGKDPYEYYFKSFNGHQLLYELHIDKDGELRFIKPEGY